MAIALISLSYIRTLFIILILSVLDTRGYSQISVNRPVRYDESPGMTSLNENDKSPYSHLYVETRSSASVNTRNDFNESVEQLIMGTKDKPRLVASFDGLGYGFHGPQGEARLRNPSDNSLAVGTDHIIQTVNSRMAIFSKKGARYDSTGIPLYGPVETNNIFKGFGGPCEKMNNGDAVIRYDQLAGRWLLVMPLFRRAEPGINGHSGPAADLYIPAKLSPEEEEARRDSLRQFFRRERSDEGKYGMCYAISTSPDPFGSWYRYEFSRELFPDYPRPAVWPDGYYTPTSTGDHVIQKHVAIADREKMLKGEDATEQIIIIDSVNFLNTADLEGIQLPPEGSPNIMMAAGGVQLKGILEDDGIYVWKIYVNWKDPSKTRLEGPKKIKVAPYRYLGGGQLTESVPQPGTDQRLDSQGDKIMARLIYRRIGEQESIVGVHSVETSPGGGGVRWYEFRLDHQNEIKLYQQGTYCPDSLYRWMASPAMDGEGNIGIGYSYGGITHFPGQRFAGRLNGDPKGIMSLKEAILVDGEASQTNTLRWEDYTQTAMDPSDDMTIWYVGDYIKKGAESYSTRIGAFRLK